MQGVRQAQPAEYKFQLLLSKELLQLAWKITIKPRTIQ